MFKNESSVTKGLVTFITICVVLILLFFIPTFLLYTYNSK